jgi:bacterioferritin
MEHGPAALGPLPRRKLSFTTFRHTHAPMVTDRPHAPGAGPPPGPAGTAWKRAYWIALIAGARMRQREAPRKGRGMQGDPEVIEFLNEQLTAELTAINQYFLHAKMQENFGWTKLAKYTRSESIDEMRHAEVLTDRILFLEGLPNYQRLFHVRVGQTVTEMFEADKQVEVEAIDRLRRGIEVMRAKNDITSANIFEAILADEEHHVDYLETQLDLVAKLGEPLYIAQLIEQPGGDD